MATVFSGTTRQNGGPGKGVLSWAEICTRLQEPVGLVCPTLLHVLRHGETDTNARNVVTGSQDIDLTVNGRRQARDVGECLERQYHAAFHSDLRRSRDTLRFALGTGRVDVGAIYPDRRLNERRLGDLEGTRSRSILAYAEGNLRYAPEGGENYLDVAQRLMSFLLDLTHWPQGNGPRKLLICSHMGPIRIICGIVEERSGAAEVMAQSFGNANLIRLEWRRLALPEFLKGEIPLWP